jgi:glycosyltransferase involved in cell wall biosynthesis
MLISCLTVTQPGRLDQLAHSVRCFSLQTWADREMVIVHDGGDAFDQSLHGLLDGHPGERFRVIRADGGLSLGELRNLSVRSAEGELVCQWDDDDLYHPERLAAQHRRLLEADSDFCFFTDQLHWFQNTGEFFWDDWDVERYPMNLIQGTLLGRRDMMPDYPAQARGEDTPLLQTLYRRGARLTDLAGRGYLYIYTYSGNNAWDLRHHGAISYWKRLGKEALEARRDRLARYLGDYGLPLREARFPHDGGELVVELGEPP